MQHLKAWWDGILGPSFILPFLQDATAQQQTIGWNRFLKGWVSNRWSKVQKRYFKKYSLLREDKGGSLLQLLSDGGWHGICGSTGAESFMHRKITLQPQRIEGRYGRLANFSMISK